MPIIVAWTLRKANNCNVRRTWMSWLRMTCMYNKKSTWYPYNNMSNYIFFLQFPLMFCRIFCFLYCFWYHILINQNRRCFVINTYYIWPVYVAFGQIWLDIMKQKLGYDLFMIQKHFTFLYYHGSMEILFGKLILSSVVIYSFLISVRDSSVLWNVLIIHNTII